MVSLAFTLTSSANEDVTVSEEDAINASIEYLDGNSEITVSGNLTVKEIELERENNNILYKIELVDEADNEYEVMVNAFTGEVIPAQTEVKKSDSGKRESDEDEDKADEDHDGDDNADEDDDDKGKKPEKKMKFEVSNDNFIGKYVSFNFNDSDAEITDFVLGSTPVFSTISINNF